MDNKSALLVIDVQVGMFPESDPVYNAGVLIENIKALMKRHVLLERRSFTSSITRELENHSNLGPQGGIFILQFYQMSGIQLFKK
jgi:nicotinamidase-related amidase